MNWQYYSYVKIICELSAFLSQVTVLIRDLVEESASLKLSREITSCSACFSHQPFNEIRVCKLQKIGLRKWGWRYTCIREGQSAESILRNTVFVMLVGHVICW